VLDIIKQLGKNGVPDEKYNNKTYKEYMKNLSENDKIIFEMDNKAYNTITNIYNDVKNRNFNNNILFIKIEDLYNEKKYTNYL
tara:strand:+ start:253 stop:501 length:249 start_codon:yes stop_codon:yes gene_type:complete